MFTVFRRPMASALAIIMATAVAAPALAQDVTLASADGTVNLTGQFRGIENGAYILVTAMGEMRISTDRVSCVGVACPGGEEVKADLVIGGSDTVGLGLMPLLLEGYSSAADAAMTVSATVTTDEIIAEMIGEQGFGEPMPSILVNSRTSSSGFQDLLANQIEISMASRRIRPEEARALREAGSGNMISPAQEHVIAADSLVLITHPDLPVSSLTIEEVAGIYTGRTTNWQELGGPDLPITVIDRPAGSGTRAVFEGRILGDAGGVDFDGKVIADTNTDASRMVSETQGAITYVGFAFQRGLPALTLVNECGIATTADAFSAKTEEYPLQRRLYMYSREDTLSEAGIAFLDYATSAEADTVIQKAGFTGFAVVRRDQTMDSPRARALLNAEVDAYEGGFMREMLGQMVDFDRLSSTFRFRTGSTQLDERGVIDLERLISFLQTQPQGTEVMLVGFTDDVGEFESNLSLSEQRALQVAEQVRNAAAERLPNIQLTTRGYGEIAPTACNSAEEGRNINRRVEVWIKNPS